MRSSSVLIALSLAGCGLILETPHGGMDGAARADGGAGRVCADDDECDDGLVCTGVEVCFQGRCTRSDPRVCDDGVDCTEDRCSEDAGGCVSAPGVCSSPAVECGAHRCDAVLGCLFEPRDADCDDGFSCTAERCVEGTCEILPNDSLCVDGSFCSLDGGCQPLPVCDNASDCPPRLCNRALCSAGGECSYEATADDSGCDAADPCVSVGCFAGECRRAAILCDTTVVASLCTRNECRRDGAGVASCVTVDRDGETCRPREPCSTGTCSGTRCVAATMCVSTDPCLPQVCDPMLGCVPDPVRCGPNSTCMSAMGGTAECVCDVGFSDCDLTMLGCECGTSLCTADRADCDMSGDCECDLTRGHCGFGRCITCPPCGGTYRCCPTNASCYDPSADVCPAPTT